MPSDVLIRSYSDAHLEAGRRLWGELPGHHRQLYQDPDIGGTNPGAYFDDYLRREDRVATWVAVVDDDVLGLAASSTMESAERSSP
jgi:hypothetical protein